MKRYFELDLQKLMEEEDPIGLCLVAWGARGQALISTAL